MMPSDYIFIEIYKGAIAAGAIEKEAHRCAIIGLEEWKKNKFKKVSSLITQKIAEAKKVKK